MTHAPEPAVAFDFFGLFGSSEAPPAPSRDALPYVVTFEGSESGSLENDLKATSALWRLRQEPPADGDALFRRVEVDLPRLTDVVWGAGYYDGRLSIVVGNASAATGQAPSPAIARAAEGYRNRAPVPIRIVVEPGPLFKVRTVTVRDARTGRQFLPEELPPRLLQRSEGGDAASSNVLAIEARIIDRFRNSGHPFVKVTRREPIVDHPSLTYDVVFAVEPGPKANLGEIIVRGTKDVDPAVVRSFIYAEPGDPYSPKALTDIRKSVSRIEALGSVRVREAETLDAWGRLPVAVDVTERLPRIVGFNVRYSTLDGPGLRAYWAHRNLFGGAERLRFEGDVYYTDRNDIFRFDPVTGKKNDGWDWSNIGARFSASFLKPALNGTRWDLLVDGSVNRDVSDYYTARFVNGTAALRYRFSDTFSAQGGFEVERGQSSELDQQRRLHSRRPAAFRHLRLNRQSPRSDPRRARDGVGGAISEILRLRSRHLRREGAGEHVFRPRRGGAHRACRPHRFRVDHRGGPRRDSVEPQVLCGRRRFGARLRVSVAVAARPVGEPIGGRSLLEGSIEARIKLTDTIGIVPFVDAGTAFASSWPDFDERIRFSAGLGLRYYTAIGPIRLDVAAPLERQRGDRPVALYISLGQAF